MDYLVVTGFAT